MATEFRSDSEAVEASSMQEGTEMAGEESSGTIRRTVIEWTDPSGRHYRQVDYVKVR